MNTNPYQSTRPMPSLAPVHSYNRWLILIAGVTLSILIAATAIIYAVLNWPTPTPPVGEGGPCGLNSPYGFTTIHADEQLVQDYRQLNVCWIRFQIHEDKIETAPGQYDWQALDKAVATMNAAGIHLDVPLECFRPTNGGDNPCFSHPFIPSPEQVQNYATAIATRYDGNHGHGKIDTFEILNEEADFLPVDQLNTYCPLLQSGYQAIKAAYPTAKVGMYGTFRPGLKHVVAVMDAVKGCSQYMDYANIHYYAKGGDPRVSTFDHPSLDQALNAVHERLPDKPIWITEIGWATAPLPPMQTVSPQQQADNMRFVLDTASGSGFVQRVFWFTINYGKQADSINRDGQPLPAFNTLKEYVQSKPTWGN